MFCEKNDSVISAPEDQLQSGTHAKWLPVLEAIIVLQFTVTR
ncbi:FIG00640713: hypothetical protein [Escherichia coli IS1]|nr:hypothetical protein HMPREF1588_00408 [Escherichia coli 110957]ESD42979.1 hypothetical protein HMPREF1602_02136 [Escherichia coli 907889]ETE22832.1 hypothetical protein V415_10280 [Escherichia coli LAU-EC10]EYD98002.1 hypothetical protein AC80_4662 [Escherichia coli 1-110-08_S4_C1]KDW72053.1 hypothetical protein AB14_3567 [Escherichia coli 1-392-07_S1_C1]KDW81262.1 hypothetical protein AB42_3758 [Escherichia coli 1-392-07_S1_C2]KEJ06458.1 hypothetical protein AB50_4406 [Escherichia coli 6-